ncbi:hypothetical protein N4G41_17515 [Kosakonia sacchari]|uniref:hypothetical protein n=1 Tax=Kosakonia sacchari TaxID=1158459 RepID=UPI002ACD98C3|nr:hypothetical protein [Kosakonia sacchari]MDZ7323431.1 hypothetical protein [Kosakonia sacchari]
MIKETTFGEEENGGFSMQKIAPIWSGVQKVHEPKAGYLYLQQFFFNAFAHRNTAVVTDYGYAVLRQLSA